ncbi:hypothetical protein FOH38_23225 [Lysinibacillus fusiformis]|nr:hypothetical protein FOH38_23225 [Lysinibacillus fusiformis]
MKKIFILPLLLLLSILLSACNQNQEKDSDDKKDAADNATEKTSEEGPLKVDKGLLNVEVTLPASFFEGQDIDTVITESKNDGIKEVIKNEDGSLTYKMSKSEHKEMMKELETGILEATEEIKTSGDFPSIKDVSYNKTFSEFTLSVNQEEFENSLDSMASFGLAITSMYYQLFNGVDPEKYKVTVIFKNESNGEVINTVVYPDDLNEKN